MSSSFLTRLHAKREFQWLLGKLLYTSRCVKASRTFLNRLFMTLSAHSSKFQISLVGGTLESLSRFLKFMKQFNGIVCFNKSVVQHNIYVDASLERQEGFGDPTSIQLVSLQISQVKYPSPNMKCTTSC